MKKLLYIISAISLSLLFVAQVNAATLDLITDKDTYKVGDTFEVDVKIDSEGAGINGAQAIIKFDGTLLEATKIDKTGSIFDFWLSDPTISTGQVGFVAASTVGYTGKSLQVLKITFKAKGAGDENIVLSDAAITAADGSGSNVLSKSNNLAVNLASSIGKTQPTQIARTPEVATGSPAKPAISVPLYPDSAKWNNVSARFFVNWKLPLDITGVALVLNKIPVSLPDASEGLFESKEFPPLKDGIWYLHARFENNIGWGPTTHYKIAVDTQPPLGFKINILEGEKTDNPTPTLRFKTSDAISGLKDYKIKIGDSDFIQIAAKDFTGNFKLPLQAPGKKRMLVKVVDLAENSVEDSVDIEILPITSPIITFITNELFSDEELDLTVKGIALPDINVLIKLQRVLSGEKGEVVAENFVKTDDKGNWEAVFSNQLLRNGQYVVLAQSQDSRGALSLVVESLNVIVKNKPIIQIGKFQLGMGGALIFLLIVIAGGFGGGAWFYKKRQKTLLMRVSFTESEATKIFQLVRADVERLAKTRETPTTSDDEYMLKRLQENLQKMETYLKKGIEKIKK